MPPEPGRLGYWGAPARAGEGGEEALEARAGQGFVINGPCVLFLYHNINVFLQKHR